MSKRMRMSWFVLAILLASACGKPRQYAHPMPPPQKRVTPAALSSQDRDFLERAAEGNNGEVKIGGLVDPRALSPAVIEYGHMMVADHSAAQAQLAAIATQRALVIPTSLGEHQAGYDRLVSRNGQLFDEEFMKVMIGDHQEAVELFKAEATTGVDPLLRSYAVQTLPKIEAHLARATALANIASAPQPGTKPPTPDATQKPPGSTVTDMPGDPQN